jgi:hypothetical protein
MADVRGYGDQPWYPRDQRWLASLVVFLWSVRHTVGPLVGGARRSVGGMVRWMRRQFPRPCDVIRWITVAIRRPLDLLTESASAVRASLGRRLPANRSLFVPIDAPSRSARQVRGPDPLSAGSFAGVR